MDLEVHDAGRVADPLDDRAAHQGHRVHAVRDHTRQPDRGRGPVAPVDRVEVAGRPRIAHEVGARDPHGQWRQLVADGSHDSASAAVTASRNPSAKRKPSIKSCTRLIPAQPTLVGAACTEGGIWMRKGFKVFDADAHVIYPADLWPRYLDKKFVDRVERRPPPGFDHYQPNMVDGRYTQHPTSMYGDFQKAIGWTTEDMYAQYGELMTKGFTGDLDLIASVSQPARLAVEQVLALTRAIQPARHADLAPGHGERAVVGEGQHHLGQAHALARGGARGCRGGRRCRPPPASSPAQRTSQGRADSGC